MHTIVYVTLRYAQKHQPIKTIVFDHVITNSGGNFNCKTDALWPTQYGVCVFILLFSCCCSNESYLITEQVENHQSVKAMLCSGRGADNLCYTTGVAALGWNSVNYITCICALSSMTWSVPAFLSSFTR